jgi:hypothetical protein
VSIPYKILIFSSAFTKLLSLAQIFKNHVERQNIIFSVICLINSGQLADGLIENHESFETILHFKCNLIALAFSVPPLDFSFDFISSRKTDSKELREFMWMKLLKMQFLQFYNLHIFPPVSRSRRARFQTENFPHFSRFLYSSWDFLL